MANRLKTATSPYLLQHADNPVDWWPWCEEAFDEARRRDVPVMLSVGYAACHWCHVMAHESFEDPATAAVINETVVAIKVDREERPDIDAVYMTATQAMTGQGGWPMTVFMTADGDPFHCGTYYPRPRFAALVKAVGRTWASDRAQVVDQAERISAALSENASSVAGLSAPAGDDAEWKPLTSAAVTALEETFDASDAGFGSAPKFPPSMVCEFLLREGSPSALRMAAETGEAMARGGMYDQIGGGFARYSVDGTWTIPHFEKMLYDNALLARAYLHLWSRGENPPQALALARRVAEETCEFMLRELGTEQGGFAASLDADSPGHTDIEEGEGAYYVWTPSGLRDVLGDSDGSWAADVFGVTEAGTFSGGSSVLQRRAEPDDAARFARVRSALLAARDGRPRPGRDDKVVAAWNGMAIAALAEAGLLLDRPDFLDAASSAADLLVRVHVVPNGAAAPPENPLLGGAPSSPGGASSSPVPGGAPSSPGAAASSGAAPSSRAPLGEGAGGSRLLRTSRDGRAGESAGLLEDYACVASGLLALAGATAGAGGARWFAVAGELLETVLTEFGDGTGGLYDTAAHGERLIYRPADPADNATPSGAFAAADALLSYAALAGSSRHRDAAVSALKALPAIASRFPRAAGMGLAVAEALASGPVEVAIVGPPDDPRTSELLRAALRAASPGAVFALGPGSGPGSDSGPGPGPGPGAVAQIPLLEGRGLVHGAPAAYVCRGFTCQAPVTTPAALRALLRP